MALRSTRDVFEDHLRLRQAKELEEDLRRNYAPDIVLLTANSIFHGHDGIRYSAERLRAQLPNGRYEYIAKQVDGEYALLIWKARSERCRVEFGADSFVIRDGLIRMQTVHFELLLPDGRERIDPKD